VTEEPPPFSEALERLDAMQRGAESLAVFDASLRSGLLHQLLEPCVPTIPTVPTSRVEHVLGLLEALQIIIAAGTGWQLSPAWRPLVSGQTPVELAAALGAGRVKTAQLVGALDAAVDYWRLSAKDRLLLAKGMSFNPESAAAVTMMRRLVSAVPGLTDTLEAGGRMLELGCGVASRLTALLLAFPAATAVGVELADDLAAFGRERASRLGLGERLTYVVGDAANYAADGLFDVVNWSQFFFPLPTRAGALKTARGALRPGGWLTMPCGWDGTHFSAGSAEGQEVATKRLVLDLWGVPMLSTQELAKEVEAAGFVDVHVDSGSIGHFVRGRHP